MNDPQQGKPTLPPTPDTEGSGSTANSAPAVIAALNIALLESLAGTAITQRARNYVKHPQRFTIQEVHDKWASVTVEGDSGHYYVDFMLIEEGEVSHSCQCPFAADDDDVICKHKIAAALFLEQEFPQATRARKVAAIEPPAQKWVASGGSKPSQEQSENAWRKQIDVLLFRHQLVNKPELVPGVLVFMFRRFQQRHLLQPVLIAANAVPEALRQDAKALQEFLLEQGQTLLQQGAVQLLEKKHLTKYSLLNAPAALLPLMEQALIEVMNSRYNIYLYGAGTNTANAWQALSAATVFAGTERQPFQQPLTVNTTSATVELIAYYDEQGLHLQPQLLVAGRVLSLANSKREIYCEEPLWVAINNELFKVDDAPQAFLHLCQQESLIIPHTHVVEFLQRQLEPLAQAYPLHSTGLISATVEQCAPAPRLYLTERNGELQAELRFAYTDYECAVQAKPATTSYVPVVPDAGSTDYATVVQIQRDLTAEQQWRTRLSSTEFGLRGGKAVVGAAPGTLHLRKVVKPLMFLKDHIPALAAAGVTVYGEAALTIARINRTRPSIAFSIASNLDWFDVKTAIHFGEQQVSLAEVRRALRNDRFIKLADGSLGEIPAEWLSKYQHLFGLAEPHADGLRVSRLHAALLDDVLDSDAQVDADANFADLRERFKNLQNISAQPLPQHFHATLRPYQKAGFDWLHFLRANHFGGCLADDMGTGKTVQTLAFLQALREAHTSNAQDATSSTTAPVHLLVVPRSLVINWEREAAKFAPQLRVLNFASMSRADELTEFANADIVITTYGIMLREIERLRQYCFDTVILDEAQSIKNPISASARAARMLNCKHRLTLTGTPVENNTVELWSQFAFLNPGLLGSLEYFRSSFATPIERQQDEAATQTLRKLVYPFILRRTKDQVAQDLPPRSEEILWGDMEGPQRKLYDSTRDAYRAKLLKLIAEQGVRDVRFQVLEGLLRLRQICNDPRLYQPSYTGGSAKLTSLLETLVILQAEGHKVLVFSQFVGMLKLIEQELKRSATPYAYLDGATRNRQAQVDDFQQQQAIKLFLISLKAGGVGLNLTAADYVIHVDPWWNPAVEMQATDRAHRIGQTRPVFVYKLLMRDSVEEKILQLQERKRSLVKNLITTETGFFKSLSEEDIAGLFS